MATDIKILCAGAVKPGMVKVIDAFRRETGHEVKVIFATAPAILERISGMEKPDAVIAPLAVLDECVKAGKATQADCVIVGRIGVGVMVRSGAPLPKIATTEEFKQSLLGAEAVIYNQASTGIYLEKLFDRLGITEQLKTKTTRYPDAAAVLNHVSKTTGNAIGLGATTVIIEGERSGLQLVAPLPSEIQNYTIYAAAVTGSGATEPAREFVRFLATPEARKILSGAGIE